MSKLKVCSTDHKDLDGSGHSRQDVSVKGKYYLSRSLRLSPLDVRAGGSGKSAQGSRINLKKSILKDGISINKSLTPVRAKGSSQGPEQLFSGGEHRYYSLKDYKMIKPSFSVRLGGLGPCSIGSDSWQVKRELYEKRLRYGNFVYNSNAANIPLFPAAHHLKVKESKTTKALNFAKSIKRPYFKLSK